MDEAVCPFETLELAEAEYDSICKDPEFFGCELYEAKILKS